MGPPALHHRVRRKIGHPMILAAPKHRKEDVGFPVEVDRIIRNTRLVQQSDQFREYGVVALFIFGRAAGMKPHLEGDLFERGNAPLLSSSHLKTPRSARLYPTACRARRAPAPARGRTAAAWRRGPPHP